MNDRWRSDFHELLSVLVAATEVRHLRPDWDGDEIGWVRHERNVMHDAVNTIRARYEKPPAAETAIAAAESRALGHFDYVKKFALGCADIVHDRQPA